MRKNRINSLRTLSGELTFPVFFPDATRGFVKSLDTNDLDACGVEGIVVNTIHLQSKPGLSTIKNAGRIHEFISWDKPVLSDSGGFQVFSFINSGASGDISKNGFTYKLDGEDKKRELTPEKCIRIQLKLGADIIYCLDYCTHPSAPYDVHQESVRLTIDWAKRCKKEYNKLTATFKDKNRKPLLFAIVQGGDHPDLRKRCAEELLSIGFDGYGFGGWPINDNGTLIDAVQVVADLIPEEFPTHGLGIGKPENLADAYKMGYDIFDCVIPTRDARHKRLYVFNGNSLQKGNFYDYVYIGDEKYMKDPAPVEEGCDCLTCTRFSRGYLNHLFSTGDPVSARLASIHNVRFYTRLIAKIRGGALG